MDEPAIHKKHTSWKHNAISFYSFQWSPTWKVLRLLNHMQVACISDGTHYRHQGKFFEPAVLAVWEVEQFRLLVECKAKEDSLNNGGDRRADSSGHSAK